MTVPPINLTHLREWVSGLEHESVNVTVATLLALIDTAEADLEGWRNPNVSRCEHCGAPTLETRTPILASLARYTTDPSKEK